VHNIPLSTISTAALLTDVVAVMVMLYTVVRLLRAPGAWFGWGTVSKVLWLVTSLWFIWQLGSTYVPVGALLALWRMRVLSRRQWAQQPPDLPWADGEPLSAEASERGTR
jgi:hypothetical protein